MSSTEPSITVSTVYADYKITARGYTPADAMAKIFKTMAEINKLEALTKSAIAAKRRAKKAKLSIVD